MSIEISDEMIEGIARDLIKERVKQFFNTDTNKNFIRNAINSEVQRIVSSELRDKYIDIKKIAGENAPREDSNTIIIPPNATNGDMIKAIFPTISKYKNILVENHHKNVLFDDSWWNAPYKGVE